MSELGTVKPTFQCHKPVSFIISSLGLVAQSVEQRIENPCVGGSIPPRATKKHQNHLRVVFSFVVWQAQTPFALDILIMNCPLKGHIYGLIKEWLVILRPAVMPKTYKSVKVFSIILSNKTNEN